ncbi:hypothetical protein [Pseudomonas sp. RL_105y_Pfl1_103]|uniref:hypothetical protein n=1 Tax=Pseudomonas sp. RL_105y_Pfl1_103 TaxID=3088707 RepID=UPI0030D9D94D
MVWQRAGTVAVQNGSNTVIGTNLDFAASCRNGDSFIGPDGASYEVVNVASSTVISILPAYGGPTVSGASYAIMPVQGYDKLLSDAFNALVNQFGAKLAALGSTGNYETLPVTKGGTGGTSQAEARAGIGAAAKGSNSDITSITGLTTALSIAQGGTGGNTQSAARTALGVDVTLASAILDPASGGLMSSTVVSGFTILKFLNGAMCMLGDLPVVANVAVNASINVTVIIPAGFLNTISMFPIISVAANSTIDHYGVSNYFISNTNSFNFSLRNGASGVQSFSPKCSIWGKWK